MTPITYFLSQVLKLENNKPHILLFQDCSNLQHELARKDELIKRHHEKITMWLSLMAEMQSPQQPRILSQGQPGSGGSQQGPNMGQPNGSIHGPAGPGGPGVQGVPGMQGMAGGQGMTGVPGPNMVQQQQLHQQMHMHQIQLHQQQQMQQQMQMQQQVWKKKNYPQLKNLPWTALLRVSRTFSW